MARHWEARALPAELPPRRPTLRELSEATFSVKDAARVLGLKERTIREWIYDGRIPCIRIGGRRIIRMKPEDVLRVAEKET
jgi:excisionase family DNA binding protein